MVNGAVVVFAGKYLLTGYLVRYLGKKQGSMVALSNKATQAAAGVKSEDLSDFTV